MSALETWVRDLTYDMIRRYRFPSWEQIQWAETFLSEPAPASHYRRPA